MPVLCAESRWRHCSTFQIERVRVIQTETGGGFGGKEEYPNMIAGHAALLSWKSGGRPVKMIYDRREDMWATTKRHPSKTHIKAGFKRDGTLVALDIDIVLDGGAYPTLSSVVLSRATLHAWGPISATRRESKAASLRRTRSRTALFAALERLKRSSRSKCT